MLDESLPETERFKSEFNKIFDAVKEIGEIGVELVEQDKAFPDTAFIAFSKSISELMINLGKAIGQSGKQ